MNSTLAELRKEKIVAIIRLDSIDEIIETAHTLFRSGIKAMEIALDNPKGLKAVEKVKEQLPDALVGVGTVLDPETARLAITSGADFIFTPTLKKETIEVANRYHVPIIPGVLTPTEVLAAYEYGVDTVKIFPIRPFGPKYISDIKGPLPFVDVMPVGGVSIENAEEYLNAGASILGIGSSLVDSKLVHQGNFDEIERRARKLVDIVNKRKAPQK